MRLGQIYHYVINTIYTWITYADVSTLVAVVPSPGERVAVSESMNLDLMCVVCGVTSGE